MTEAEKLLKLRLHEGEVLRLREERQHRAAMEADLAAAIGECSQLRVQLAGCGVAAMGGTDDSAKPGDYGWSPAYQAVLELRAGYEALLAENRELRAELVLHRPRT